MHMKWAQVGLCWAVVCLSVWPVLLGENVTCKENDHCTDEKHCESLCTEDTDSVISHSRFLRRWERLQVTGKPKQPKFYKVWNVTNASAASAKSSPPPHRKRKRKKGNRTVSCPVEYKQMFLWDAVKDPAVSSWFEVVSLHEVSSDEEIQEGHRADTYKERIFYLHAGVVKRHMRMSSLETISKFNPGQFDFPHDFNKEALDVLFEVSTARANTRRMAVFKNARVTGEGVIMNDLSVCQAVRNGGANFTSNDTMSFLSYQNENIPENRRHSQIITLANIAQGSWHFPMELLVALANVNQSIVSNSKIHVRTLEERKMWLNYFNIEDSAIIEGINGSFLGDVVYAPEMATYGKPTTSQLYWMRQHVKNMLGRDVVSGRRSIVVIQRKSGDERALADFSIIRRTLYELAELLNYDLIVHQDISNFEYQFKRFSNAAIVVGPHGAGNLFINFAPADLCFIELISSHEPLCFARIAYLRGQNYISVARKSSFPRTANMTKLAHALRICTLHKVLSLNNVMKSKVDHILLNLVNYVPYQKSNSTKIIRPQDTKYGSRAVPCPSSFKQLFLWDAVKDPHESAWFEVEDLHEVVSEEEECELVKAETNHERIFYIQDIWVTKRHFNVSNSFGSLHGLSVSVKKTLDTLFDVTVARAKTRKMAIFQNARLTEDGLIMNNNAVCQAVRNGGANISSDDTVSFLSYQNDTVPKGLHHSQIITLANISPGSWHFPVELFLALANVNQSILSNSKIHVKNLQWSKRWLKILHVKMGSVISGTVSADRVLAPQMPSFGYPSTSQFYWFRQTLGVHHVQEETTKQGSRSIIFIGCKKGDRCALSDSDSQVILSTLARLAKLLKYDFSYHINSGSLSNKIKSFEKSSIVVFPHSSAGIYINFTPSDICLIEIMLHRDPVLAFARLAYLRGQDYIGVPLSEKSHGKSRHVDMESLSLALNTCARRGNIDDTTWRDQVVNVLSPLTATNLSNI